MVKFTWKIWNRLNRKKNQISGFPIFTFRVMQKYTVAGNSLNVVEREPVPTRVLNPNASEAIYKPKQRSYRKTKLIYYFFFSGGFYPGTLPNVSKLTTEGSDNVTCLLHYGCLLHHGFVRAVGQSICEYYLNKWKLSFFFCLLQQLLRDEKKLANTSTVEVISKMKMIFSIHGISDGSVVSF